MMEHHDDTVVEVTQQPVCSSSITTTTTNAVVTVRQVRGGQTDEEHTRIGPTTTGTSKKHQIHMCTISQPFHVIVQLHKDDSRGSVRVLIDFRTTPYTHNCSCIHAETE